MASAGYDEERLILAKRMNSLLGHMKDVKSVDDIYDEMDEFEVEEQESNGIKLHFAKMVLVGYIRNIESLVIEDDVNKDTFIPLNDICQVCYLFYFGLYPSIYVLNGSGEDADEYHCNGVLYSYKHNGWKIQLSQYIQCI